MKISLKWLADYVALPASVEELAHRLTMAGLEVEGIEQRGTGLDGVVVAQIKESVGHPNADKLSVTQVDIGGGSPLQIVCGAKNYQVGDKVPLATSGTKLPNGMEIKVSALRGVESRGMLCSAKELGLAEESSGLLILDPTSPLGAPIAQALQLQDTVFEVNVTPNRADALSHLGVAREVAVLTGGTVKAPARSLQEGKAKASEKIQIRIDAPERCLRYTARVVEGVKVGSSPAWLKARLEACGVRSINNVVDVTNYVLLEYGQPLHAFDLDKLAGAQVVVRLARAGEKLVTLDGKERTLEADDLLICDRDKPQVLAGVMGGADSEVNAHTQRILLEAAHFQPASIRRSSKRHALHSESSHRFERGTDLEVLPAVLDRAAALIAELGQGTVLAGLVDLYPSKLAPRSVALRPARLAQVLGVEVPLEELRRILGTLGFVEREAKHDALHFDVPTFRNDVTLEEDLIEEVARIWGYDAIVARLPRSPSTLRPESARMGTERRVRLAMAGAGFDEVVNYSFVSAKELGALGAPTGVALLNPLSTEQSVMRTSMFAGLLQNVSRNLRHQVTHGRLYELGRIYLPDPSGGHDGQPVAKEELKVAGVLWGARTKRSWTAREVPVDFFDAKGAVETVLQTLHLGEASFEALEGMPYHPRAAAQVLHQGVVLGALGELHPRVAKQLGLPHGVFLFELDVERLWTAAQLVPAYVGLGKFPAVLRDLAVVVPTELRHEQVRQVITEVGAPLVKDASLFDVYTGKPIPEGKKNLAYALEYRAPDRTLTDSEVNEAHAKIVEEVNRRLGGSLRGA